MLEEELSEMRARSRTALFEFVKNVGICAVGGGVGAVAGWL